MSMHRAYTWLVGLVWLSLVTTAAAQPVDSGDTGVVTLDEVGASALVEGVYFDVRTQTGDGVGYRNGYTQLGLFSPFWLTDNAYIASNGRLFVTDNGFLGTNAGGVARIYDPNTNRIFGVNGYYDNDRSTSQRRYRQITAGVETLGEFWDFRANGYFPTNTDENFLGAVGLENTPFYSGNQIVVNGIGAFEQSLSGGDFEFGAPVTSGTPWLRAFAGMYFYNGDGDDPLGFRGRIEGNISDDLTLAVQVTEDETFGTNVNAIVDFRFAGFKPTRYFPQWTTRERMLAPVQRNWRVATAQRTVDVEVATIDPSDDLPYFVVHVDPGAAGGDGTFENPFGTMPATSGGADIVLVQRGNTTQATPLASNITLDDNTRLLGEGKDHRFDYYAIFGGFGVGGSNAVLPDFDNDGVLAANGNFPFLTGAGDAVTLANNNEVAAFAIGGSTGAAIAGSGITDFNLHHLEIFDNAGGGIVLADASGSGVINNINTNTVTGFVNPTFGGNGAPGGIVIDTGVNPLDLTLTDIVMNQNAGPGVSLTANDGDLTVDITNVITNFSTAGAGTELIADGANLTATLTNLVSTGNAGDGLNVQGLAGGTATVFAGTTNFNGNGDNGLDLLADAGVVNFLQTGTLNASFNQNSNLLVTADNGGTVNAFFGEAFLNNSIAGSGAEFVADNTSVIGSVTLNNAQINNNAVHGVSINANNTSAIGVNVIDSMVTGNGVDAFNVVLANMSNANLFVDPTDASGSTRDGLNFDVTGGSLFNGDFIATNMSNSGRSAVFGVVDASTVNLDFDTVDGSTSGEHGVVVVATTGAALNIVANDTTFSDSGQSGAGFDGMNIDADASFVTLDLDQTNLANFAPNTTQDDGLVVNLNNAATLEGDITSSNFAGNDSNAIEITADNGSTAELEIASLQASDSGEEGILLDADNSAAINLDITGSAFNGSGANGTAGLGDGLSIAADNAGIVQVQLDENSSMTDSFENGIEIVANTGSTVTVVTDAVALDNSGVTTGGNAVLIDADAATVAVGLFNTTATNAGGDAVLIDATNAADVTLITLSSDLSDSGQTAPAAGLNVNVADASQVDLLILNTQVTNSVGNTPQEQALLFNVITDGDLTAQISGSNFNNHTAEGINGSIDGAGSTADITIDSTTIDNNGSQGVLLSVTNTAQLDFTTQNGTSISNNAADGVFAIVDGVGTIANFTFNDTNIDNNGQVFGGDGLNVNPSNGATVNVISNGSSFSGNIDQGMEIDVNSASVVTYDLTDTTIDNNGAQGVLFNVTDGTLNFTMDGTSISNNGQFGPAAGIDGTTTGATAITNLVISNTAIDGNTFGGVQLNNLAGGNLLAAFGPGVSISNNTNSDGLHLLTSGAGTVTDLLFVGDVNVNGNAEGGVDLIVDNTATLNTVVTGGLSASNNLLSDGFLLTGTGPGTTVSLLMFDADGSNVFDGNAGSGIDINLTDIAGPSTIQLDGSASGNSLNGVSVDLVNSNLQFVYGGGGTVADDAISNNTLGGIDINLNNSDLVVSSRIAGVTIDNNQGGAGVSVLSLGSGGQASDITLAMVSNTITNNDGNGVEILSNGGTHELSFGNGLATTGNTITGNNGDGILLDFNNAIAIPNLVANVRLDGNDISNNLGNGIDINLAQDSALDFRMGIFGNPTQGTISGNQDAGIALNQINDSTATLIIRNVAITGNLNGPDVTQIGSGIDINLLDNASLTNSVIGQALVDNTEISGNAGNGISVFTDSFASVTNTRIQNVDITGNTGDGINFNRLGDSEILGTVIDGNEITGNSDGIDISARAADTDDDYLINNNNISNNVNRGISLFVEADADLDVDVTNNDITNNGSDGIQVTTNLGPTDTGNVVLLVDTNLIDGNGGDAIDIAAVHTATIQNNDLTNNTGNGVLITGPTLDTDVNAPTIDTIDNNLITDNGLNGISIQSGSLNATFITNNDLGRNGNDGVVLSSTGDLMLTLVDQNNFFENAGDGIQYTAVNSGDNPLLGPNEITISNNQIVDSGRRGINVVNGGDAQTNLTIDTNRVERSELEGVYIVNTSATNQNADANANDAMALGGTGAVPILAVEIFDNVIVANGNVSDASQLYDTTGLVLRVGTSATTNNGDFTFDGGVASNNTSAGFNADVGNATFGGITRGGVQADVQRNLFGGQFGADVTFNAFVSTTAPATTGGVWTDQNTDPRDPTDDAFQITNYTNDPLARLDLRFTADNAFTNDGIVASPGVGGGIIVARGDASQVFYNNDEPIFKSRTQAQDNATDIGADDNGPYNSGTRLRNATRLADRGALPPTLTIIGVSGSSDNFLFPGEGGSTFRRTNTSSTTGFLNNDSFFDAVGIGGDIGEENFIWAFIP